MTVARWVRRIGSIGLALLLSSGFANAATTETPVPLPDTTAPGLLLLILLDSSSTMHFENGQGTSAHSVNQLKSTRGTDPSNLRDRAVQRLLDTLATDKAANHQVAIFSFAKAGDDKWLTGSSPDNHFVKVADLIDPNKLTFPAGSLPGDTAVALEKTLQEFLARSKANAQLKPVILLITDDVPIKAFDESPWFSNGLIAWRAYMKTFNAQLDTLRKKEAYTAGFCRHAEGGDTLATFALGDASWLPADADTLQTFPVPTGVVAPPAYFEQMALTRHWQTLPIGGTPAQPLVYRIDPALLGSDSTLADDLRTASQNFLTEMRCMRAQPVQRKPNVSDGEYTFNVSSLYPQFQLILENMGGEPKFDLFRPNESQAAVSSSALSASKCTVKPAQATEAHWRVLTCRQADFGSGAWAGQWTLKNDGLPARFEHQLDVSKLDWQEDAAETLKQPKAGENRTYTLWLCLKNERTDTGCPVTNRIRAAAVEGVVSDVIGQLDYNNQPQGASFVFNPQADGSYHVEMKADLTQKPSYRLSLAVHFAFDYGDTLHQGIAYQLPHQATLQYSSQRSLQVVQPLSGATWLCPNGQQPFQISVGNDLAGLSGYARIELYYLGTAGDASTPPTASARGTITTAGAARTPIAVLRAVVTTLDGNPFGGFEGTLDCRLLQSDAARQLIEVRAFMPGNPPPPQRLPFFYHPPTTTPSLAVPPTATVRPVIPTPTFTTVQQRLVEAPFSPPFVFLWPILAVLAVVRGAASAPAVWVAYRRRTPLAGVRVHGAWGTPPPEDHAAYWANWLQRHLPLAERLALSVPSGRNTIFAVRGTPEGGLIIENRWNEPISVNGQAIAANGNAPFDAPEVRITFSVPPSNDRHMPPGNYTYDLINYRPQ